MKRTFRGRDLGHCCASPEVFSPLVNLQQVPSGIWKVKYFLIKKVFSIVLLLSLSTALVACQDTTNAQTSATRQDISVDQFEKKLAEVPGAQLVDVRTAEEYANGHLKNAVNMNINREDYKQQFNALDKKQPVFVYCLSGGRSSRAAKIMEEMGFTQIYNMEGGIMKWQNAGKPVEQGAQRSVGMSVSDLNRLVNVKNFVLVDYNAPWCEPCRKMLPMLEALSEKKKNKVKLLKINADENKALLKEKGIEGIPYLELYRDGKLYWKHNGYLDEEQLLQETKL